MAVWDPEEKNQVDYFEQSKEESFLPEGIGDESEEEEKDENEGTDKES